MFKNLTLLLMISASTITSSISIGKSDEIRYKNNAYRVFNNYSICISKEDKFDDFWTPKNESYLNEVQNQKVKSLKEKFQNGENLTITEKNDLKLIKSEVIKVKLGEEKFKELEKLIEKRESDVELTLPERQRLYELNKEARN